MDAPTLLIQSDYYGRERTQAIRGATSLGVAVEIGHASDCREGWCPVGTVEFCEEVLGYHPRPDYYPAWLRSITSRSIERIELAQPTSLGASRFVKRAERYKIGRTGVVHPSDILEVGEYYAAEVVRFVAEWRYYIAEGEVLSAWWYDGIGDELPAPAFPCEIPRGMCAAIDLGLTASGIELVEAQHPYACGWYGEDAALWVLWLLSGWRWMLEASAGIAGK